VKGTFVISEDAEGNFAVFEVTRPEVMQVLFSAAFMEERADESVIFAYGTTHAGRYLMVMLEESVTVDDEWNVLIARDMSTREKERFLRWTTRWTARWTPRG